MLFCTSIARTAISHCYTIATWRNLLIRTLNSAKLLWDLLLYAAYFIWIMRSSSTASNILSLYCLKLTLNAPTEDRILQLNSFLENNAYIWNWIVMQLPSNHTLSPNFRFGGSIDSFRKCSWVVSEAIIKEIAWAAILHGSSEGFFVTAKLYHGSNSREKLDLTIQLYILDVRELVNNIPDSQWYKNKNYSCSYTCFLRYRN